MRKGTNLGTKALALGTLLAGISFPVRAMEVIPLYNVSLVGGQYFFSGDKSNLRANIKALAAPALKLNEDWTLLPRYNANYRGIKSVTDGVAAGTLYQQGMDHNLAMAGIYKPEGSDWRFRPSFNYRFEFLKETRDETWGKGLFDYQNVGVGFSAENVRRKSSPYRFGYEFYYTRFPNYDSLESQSGVDPSGNALGRESAGVNVLDTFNHAFSASVGIPYRIVYLNLDYRLTWQAYPDQPVISAAGQPQSNNRRDFMNSLTALIRHDRGLGGGGLRMNAGFDLNFMYNASNQNTYDAGQTFYVGNSYSYYAVTAGPGVDFFWGEKKKSGNSSAECLSSLNMGTSCFGASFSYTHQQFQGRLAQNTAGAYLGDNQYQDRYILSLSYGYPIASNFRLTARTDVYRAQSNMAYEKTYRYSYTTANYLLGFMYDY